MIRIFENIWKKTIGLLIIKYKGDCPIEDCGGIYGYYECLDVISDKDDPEYEERLEWMESQGYPKEYDMQDVN